MDPFTDSFLTEQYSDLCFFFSYLFVFDSRRTGIGGDAKCQTFEKVVGRQPGNPSGDLHARTKVEYSTQPNAQYSTATFVPMIGHSHSEEGIW